MQYILTKAKLTAPMFDGRGYLVDIRDNKERRGLMGALGNGCELYMSRDAVEVVRRWIRMWELHLDGDEDHTFIHHVLHLSGIEFVLYDIADYGCMELKNLHQMEPERVSEIFAVARANFTTGFDEATWHKQNDHFASHVMESYNDPGRTIQFSIEKDWAMYTHRFVNKPALVPYVSRNLEMIRIAEALLSVANTRTYPSAGYKLDLKLGFGNMELADLTREQLLEIAERLIP